MNSEYTIIDAEFEHLVLKGASYEIGYEQGKILQRDPETVPIFTAANLKPRDLGFRDIQDMINKYDQLCPGITDEVQGFSDSLGIPIEKAHFYSHAYAGQSTCAHMVTLPSLTKDGHVYVGRSYEEGLEIGGIADRRLCVTAVTGKFRHIGFSSCLFGRLDGVNEHGLSITISGGTAADWTNWPQGFDFNIVFRSVLENHRTVSDALAFLRRVRLATFASFILADKSGYAARVEVAGNRLEFERIDSETEAQYLVATNHFTLGDFPKLNKKKEVIEHSTLRYAAIESWIKENATMITKEKLKTILSREIPEGCLCPYYQYGFGTLWSIVFDLTESHADVCFGAPKWNEWRAFNLDTQTGVTKYPVRFPCKNIEI